MLTLALSIIEDYSIEGEQVKRGNKVHGLMKRAQTNSFVLFGGACAGKMRRGSEPGAKVNIVTRSFTSI